LTLANKTPLDRLCLIETFAKHVGNSRIDSFFQRPSLSQLDFLLQKNREKKLSKLLRKIN